MAGNEETTEATEAAADVLRSERRDRFMGGDVGVGCRLCALGIQMRHGRARQVWRRGCGGRACF